MDHDMAHGSIKTLLILAAVAVFLIATSSIGLASGEARAGSKPKLVQLSYEETNDGSSKRYNLSAFARRSESVTFAVRKRHERLAAPAKFNKSVTDTDLPNGPVSHPWEIIRKGSGKRVLRQIRRSLNRKGEIQVRIRMKGSGGVSKNKLTIVAADCASDPPFYPLSCEV